MSYDTMVQNVETLTDTEKLNLISFIVNSLKNNENFTSQNILKAKTQNVEIEKINKVYANFSKTDQLNSTQATMATMWEAVKNDSW